MCIRIQLSRATVKELHSRLQHSYQRDDVRLVRRTTVWLDLLIHHVPVEVRCEQWGLSPAGIYGWRQAFLRRGMNSLAYRHGGGRRPKLTATQQKRVGEWLEAGPRVVGCATACWTSVLIRGLIWRALGVRYTCQSVWTLLPNLGVSLQKARFGSEHLATAKRLAWLAEQWPALGRAAQRCHGLSLFEDEASFAQWGSLSYTWARRGQQPEVKTSGKRKGDQVFGAIEYGSGRLCSQGIAGRFTSESSQACWQMILAHTQAHLFVIQDGARDHTSRAPQPFWATQRERITAYPLPSSSPDYNPIAYLWTKTKNRATHKQSFKEFAALAVSVDKALAYCAMHRDTVLELFGLYCEDSGLELTQAA